MLYRWRSIGATAAVTPEFPPDEARRFCCKVWALLPIG